MMQIPSTFCLLKIHLISIPRFLLTLQFFFIVMGIMFGGIKKPFLESIIAFYLCT